MEKLVELVKALHPKRVTYVDIFSNNLNAESKLMQLYEGIRSGTITDNASGIDLLYPDDPDGKSRFAKLKSYFKKRLLNTALLAEAKGGDRRKAFFDCLRTFIIAYFLIMLQARANGIQILKNKLKVMQHYDFTFLTIEASKVLRQHYAAIVGDLKTAQYYNQIINNYLSMYVVETQVEGFYHGLMSYYVRNKTSPAHISQLCDTYIARMPDVLPKNASTSLIFKRALILIVREMSVQRYKMAQPICAEAIDALKNKAFQDHTALAAIYFQWATCHLSLGEFEQCKSLLTATMQYLRKGEYNWYKGMLTRIDVSLKTEDYQLAYQYYLQATHEKNFKKLNMASLEEWTIYGAYIDLLKTFDVIDVARNFQQPAVDPSDILDNVSIFTKDKQGFNVPIIIYSMLLLIHRENYAKIIDESHGLLKYASRYMKDEKHRRSILFMKMLVYACKMKYGQSLAADRINSYFDRLKQSEAQSHLIDHDLEIIPYENLWQILAMHLSTKNWFRREFLTP